MKNNKPLTVAYKPTADGTAFIGFVLEKPGVMSFGPTIDELLENIEDAVRCMDNYDRKVGAEKSKRFINDNVVQYLELHS